MGCYISNNLLLYVGHSDIRVVKSRLLRSVVHVAGMGRQGIHTEVLVGILLEIWHLEDQGVERSIVVYSTFGGVLCGVVVQWRFLIYFLSWPDSPCGPRPPA